MRIWYDQEGDYLEVIFDQKPGFFRETTADQVMAKVDQEGNPPCRSWGIAFKSEKLPESGC